MKHLLAGKKIDLPRLLNLVVVAALLTSTLATLWFVEPVLVARAAAFSSGDLVVYRVGTGTGSLVNTGNAVFLDEYSPTGTLVQSIALPSTASGANKPLIASGTATSEGLLTLSADGKYLLLAGYGTAPGGTTSLAGTTGSTVPRVVGRVDGSGTVDTTTALTDFASGNNPRSVVSSNGTDLWVAGAAGGVRYATLGGTTSAQLSTTVTNLRQVNIFNGQLYTSDSSGSAVRLGTVGTGLPTTSGQTITNLPGFQTSTGSPYAFYFADLSSSVPGVDTLYVADDSAGITKYSLVGGNWVTNGTAGSSSDAYRGLTATVSGTTLTLFATRGGGSGATGGGELVSLVDASGYNGAFSGSPTVIATASTNTAFRGVAFAPTGGTVVNTAPSITTQPASQTINSGQTATLTVAASGTTPLSYQWYQGNSGDTSSPIGGATASSFTTPALSATTSYWVRVTNSVGSADSSTATITVITSQVCSGTFTHTYEVQGTTDTSPLAGQTVTVEGVVVGDNEGPSPALGGYFIQDESGDGNPATSDGLYVYNGSKNSVSAGQVVRVTGPVSEYQGQTEITANTIESCNRTATITPTDVTLPLPSADYLERFEGMLVRFPQTLYVTESYQLGRFDQLVLSSGSRLHEPTQLADPGAPAQAIQAANNLNQIILDDNSQAQDPDPIIFGGGTAPLSASNTLRIGDTATGIVGILNYTWAGNSASPNAYRIRPTVQPNFVAANPRPASPENVGGTLRVAGMNLLNFFNTFTGCTFGVGGALADCRGAENQTEFDRQVAKTLAAIKSTQADVIAFSEIENDGYGPNSAIADLVNRLNAATAPNTYAFIDADANTGQTNALGTDAIKVGIIYKPAKVTPVGQTAVLNTGALGLFNLQGGIVQGRSRPALAQSFKQNSNNEEFTVVANHLKSKGSGCDDNISPVGPDPDTGDGQGNCNLTRTQAAREEAAWLATYPTGIADPDILVMGDMNAYAKEDPIKAFESGGFTNLIASKIGPNAYSYVFDGESGYLDHALASSSLVGQVTGVSEYHNNADEPTVLDYNTNFKSAGQLTSLYAADQFRASDHDPVLVGLNLHPQAVAKDDTYTAEAGSTLNVSAGQGILANDQGGPLTIINNTSPAHGKLTLNPDGSFSYVPDAGYTGPDSFNYTVNNAVQLYSTNLPPLATIGGVPITAGGYGSSLTPVPGSTDEFYGVTDRGPNVDGPNGTKVEPLPDFDPAIGKFKFVNGQAVLEQIIPLQAADGTPYSGRVNTQASTGETITDLNGNILPPDPNGYDSEGLVALPDGTFWVSDEYGPFITHFDATGKQIGRLSPFDGTLPVELKYRVPNKGMEGLTITPDGTTLVGIMQSALQQPDYTTDPKKNTPLRIVTYKLSTGETHEYIYLLDNPISTKTAVSEITALTNTTFLVDERDSNFPPGAYKKLWKIDISGATDIGPNSTVAGTTYDGNSGGLLILGSPNKTLDLLVKEKDTATAQSTLLSKGITPVSKSLFLDVGDLLTTLDPQGQFFSHDKLEGVAVLDGGNKIVISNDSDFGIDGVTNSTPPFQLHAKTSPATGKQDDGEFLVVDMTQLPTATSTAKVTINVQDTLPPTTTDNAPSSWQKADFTVTLTCADTAGGTGCKATSYRLDGGNWQSGNTVAITTEGDHLLEYYSVDQANNQEAIKSVHAKLDKTNPSITLTTPQEGVVYQLDQEVVANYTCDDNPNGSGIASCAGNVPSGSKIDTTTPGVYTFVVTASDKAGNSASVTTKYTVLAPRDYIKLVRDNIVALRSGVTDKTDGNKLDQVISSLDKALDPALWSDASHPFPNKSDKVFGALSDAVSKLQNLQNSKKSNLSDADLQIFINQLNAAINELTSLNNH